jgi:hypothetical protein
VTRLRPRAKDKGRAKRRAVSKKRAAVKGARPRSLGGLGREVRRMSKGRQAESKVRPWAKGAKDVS